MKLNTHKCLRATQTDAKYSIVIPTWNNLPYLQLCIGSLRKNSTYRHQIIVMINEGVDGTKEWVESQSDIDYVYSETNIGICYGLNACRNLVQTTHILYANDDMYFLPKWDFFMDKKLQSMDGKTCMISATMIEPHGNNPCCIIADFGDDLQTFRENDLLSQYQNLKHTDWSGSTWPPVLVSLDLWDKVGGMSVEFSPGMYSDPDLSLKLWNAGVRNFIGVGNSLVYHFGCKSTKRVKQNRGRHTFTMKWGFSANVFMHQFLKIGEPAILPLNDYELTKWQVFIEKFKIVKHCITGK